MKRKDMIKRIEAGESLVDICLDKYREVQCKLTNDEFVELTDVGERTCALCYKFLNCIRNGLSCSNCPLTKAGHKCTGNSKSSWSILYNMIRDGEGTKEERQNAVDDMISDLKDAKEYETPIEKTYHIGQHFLYENEDEYLLARVERRKVNLFNLSSGGKWSTTIEVSNDKKITESEMKKLADTFHQWKSFKLIEE